MVRRGAEGRHPLLEEPLTNDDSSTTQADGYDPKKSQVNDDKLAEFIRASITGDIREVPGIGDAARKALASGEDDEKAS
jgi:hypothetical protein